MKRLKSAGAIFLAVGASCTASIPFLGIATPNSGSVQTSGSPEQSDLPLQFAVWWEEVRRLVRAGEPPWISERIGGGVPLFANGQTGLPWPIQAPVWVWGPEVGTTIMAALKVMAAFWGMWRWLGWLGCGIPARWLGSVSFSLSLNMISWLPVPLTWVVAATPWTFWLLGRTLRGEKRATSALAILLGGLLGWSTHPETAAFLFLALVLAGVVVAWGRRRRLLRLPVPFALAACVGAGFGLPVILTIGDSSKFAAIIPPTVELSWYDKLQLVSLFLVPFRLGHPADGTFAFPFPHAPVALACGSVVLLVILTGPKRLRFRRWELALGSVAVGALVLLFEVPGFRELGRALPVLRHMTWPRAGFLIPFVLITLAALRFPKDPVSPKKTWLACALLQLVILALSATSLPAAASRVWPTAFVPSVAALALWVPRASGLLPLLAALEVGFWSLGVLPWAREGTGDPLVLRLASTVVPGERIIAVNEVVPANLLARYGLEDLRSHDPVRPRALAALHEALGASGKDLPGPITKPWAGVAGAWGVKWLLTGPEGLPPITAEGWEEVDRSQHLRLYRNRRFLPVLRLVTKAVPSPGQPGEGEWETVDFARAAVLPSPPTLSGSGELAITERRPWRVRIRVGSGGQVLAVLHTPRASGWHAFVDGQEVPILEADLGAMAVLVPMGTHTVEWRYWPPGFWLGLGLGLLGLAGAVVYPRMRSRHAAS